MLGPFRLPGGCLESGCTVWRLMAEFGMSQKGEGLRGQGDSWIPPSMWFLGRWVLPLLVVQTFDSCLVLSFLSCLFCLSGHHFRRLSGSIITAVCYFFR